MTSLLPSRRECELTRCQNARFRKGLCNKHYRLWKLYDDPLAGTENQKYLLAPDGSGAHASIGTYRGYNSQLRYRLRWTVNGKNCTLSLRTSDKEEAQRRAEICCGIAYGRDTPDRKQAVTYWLQRRRQAAKTRAKKLRIRFELTAEDMSRMYERSGGCCEVSGIPFDLSMGKNGWKQPWRISLDRIRAQEGYKFENCRLVCNAANAAMGAWGDEALLRLARGVVTKSDINLLTGSALSCE